MTAGQRGGISEPVTYEGVTKRFGDVVAVDDLNLTVDNGELLVFLGPSGCGKTTSLRMLAGLETISGGEIRIGDVVVNELPPRARNIAMVFQSYALYSHLSVFDNLAYPLRVRKLPKQQIRERVQQVAELVQIGELLNRKPREISGGQRQRVALGRAIIRNPSVFLMDEPLSNLDAKLRVYMRGELKRFQRDLATTTIYVTHDQAEAMTLADRVAIMNKGVLQQVGPPREVYRDPANMFVAGFLGSPPMNFLQLQIVDEGGATFLRSKTLDLRAPDRWRHALASNGKLNGAILGIRPEHLHVSTVPSTVVLPAEVAVVEDLGSERLVDTRIDGQGVIARQGGDQELILGDRVYLSFDFEHAHLFDPTTERHIIKPA